MSPAFHPIPADRLGGTSAIVELYSRLFASANFRTWLALHRQPLAHLLPPPSKPLTSVTSDTYFSDSNEEQDVLVVAAGGPGAEAAGSRRVGGEAWFAHAREHMDEVGVADACPALEDAQVQAGSVGAACA